MSIYSYLSFAAAIFFLALSPGPGLAAILSRTMSGGVASGLRVVAGLVLVDFLFLALATAGMSAVASLMGPLFQIVKYAGAAYLVWLGIKSWRSGGVLAPSVAQPVRKGRDLMLGIVVTLGNPKAILFYGALLPTFFDVTQMTFGAYLVCCLIVAVVMFTVCGGYILMADRSRRFLSSGHRVRALNRGVGALLVGSGVAVATR